MANWLLNMTYFKEIEKERLELVKRYLADVRELGVVAGYSSKEKINPAISYKIYFQSEDFDKVIIGRDGLLRILGKSSRINIKKVR